MLEVISVKFSWDPDVFLLLLSLLPLNKNVSGAQDFHSIQKMVWREKKKKNVATICV